jgi:hypothetical protein
MEKFNEKLQDRFLSTPVIVEADKKVIATTELGTVAQVIEAVEFLRSVNNVTEPMRYIVRLKHNIVSFNDKTRDGFPILFTFCPALEDKPEDMFDNITTDCCTNNLDAEDL